MICATATNLGSENDISITEPTDNVFERVQYNILQQLNEQISNTNDDINLQIEELDQKLDIVLEKNEKDFLTAYRFHMLKVQNELMQLKKKANETELKSLQDSKLAELEKEIHKYQN